MSNPITPLSFKQCKEIIRGEKNNDPVISDIKFDKETGFISGLAEAFANLHAKAATFLSEVACLFMYNVSETIANNVPGTGKWIRTIMLKFQYGDVLKENLTTLAPYYPVIDPSKRIITNCASVSSENGSVVIKVAKGVTSLEPLTDKELAAAKDYYSAFAPAGIVHEIISENSDKLYIKAKIYYSGQYSETIQEDVKTAINVFLSELPFDGIMAISALSVAVKSVKGVSDIAFEEIWARDDSTVINDSTRLISEYKYLEQSDGSYGRWRTQSGYMAAETTAGYTLSDSGVLTFILS